jgi:hypothetical protein
MITRIDSNTNSLHKVVCIIILILIVSAGGGLGLVWLRQQISVTATRTQALEHEFSVLDRNIRNLDARIGELHNPNNLLRHSTALGLNIALPLEGQIVRFNRDERNIISSISDSGKLQVPGNLASLTP